MFSRGYCGHWFTVLGAVLLALQRLSGPACAGPAPSGSYAAEAAAEAERALHPASFDERIRGWTARIEWRAVYVQPASTRVCQGHGSAVHLGDGLFFSAAHLVDQTPFMDDCADYAEAEFIVEYGGYRLRAEVVAVGAWDDNGELSYSGGRDVSIVRVNPAMIVPERRDVGAPICPADLTDDGAEAIVSSEYGTDLVRTAASAGGGYGRLASRAIMGYSGSGVFDPVGGCLAGIVSSGGDQGTNYVTAHVLREFRDEEVARRAGN